MELLVVDELIVGSDLVAEALHGRGHPALGPQGGRQRQGEGHRENGSEEWLVHARRSLGDSAGMSRMLILSPRPPMNKGRLPRGVPPGAVGD